MIREPISTMKIRNASRQTGVVSEMVKTAGESGVDLVN